MFEALVAKLSPDYDWRAVPTSRGVIMRRRKDGVVEERPPTEKEAHEYRSASAW
jgi:hypothetical protein